MELKNGNAIHFGTLSVENLKGGESLVCQEPEPCRVPNTLKIGWRQYTISRDRDLLARGRSGEIDSMEAKIRVGIEATPLQLAETLLHELIHAVDSDRNLDLTETQVWNLSMGLTAVLQDLGWMPREVKLADDP